MQKLLHVLAILVAVSAHAAAPKPAPTVATVQTADQAANIARAEAYLSSLTTIAADFAQVGPDGRTTKGKFYLQRPGKMRWQYGAPNPILLVSDGKAITYYDAEMDQISYIDVDDTLAGFLAQKDIKFESPKTRLTSFTTEGGIMRATMVQKAKPQEGSLTLEFSENPIEIKQMTITDATGQTTRVALENAAYGKPLDKQLFIFEDPKAKTRRNR